jgi:hypothetical protein
MLLRYTALVPVKLTPTFMTLDDRNRKEAIR